MDNQITVALNVGGIEIPIDPNLYTYIAIIENTKNLLPTLQMGLYDAAGVSQSTPLFLAGGPLTLTFGTDDKTTPPKVYNFLLFDVPKLQPTFKGPYVEITAYYNAPQYFRSIVSKSYKGNSSEVISEIGQQCNLSTQCDSTNDSQVWLPNNRPLGQFARNVCEHGYKSSTSCMELAVTESGGTFNLKYRDIVAAHAEGPKASFQNSGITKGNNHFTFEHSLSSSAGTANYISGLGSNTLQSSFIGDFNQFSQVASSLLGGGASTISSGLQSLVGNVGNFFHPMDTQNVHDKYAESYNQNIRLKASFAIDLDVVVEEQTDLAIFDSVTVDMKNFQNTNSPVVYNGQYIVSAKTTYLTGTTFRQMLTLTTNSIVAGPGSGLIGGS